MSNSEIKEIPEINIASVSHIGPYWELSSAFEKLHAWMKDNSVKATGAPMGIYYDNPKEVEMDKLRSEAAIPVGNDAKGQGDVEIKKLSAVKAAVILYKGSYSDAAKMKSYKDLFAYIEEQGKEYDGNLPIREVYLNDPAQVKPEDLETEIIVPIK